MRPVPTAARSTETGRPLPSRLPPDLVHRPALVGRLDDAVRDRPLVVVHGPPGAGGTTLVADWASRTSAEVVWIRAEPALDGRAPFWRAVCDACGIATPDVDAPTFRSDLVRAFAAVVAAVADPAWRLGIVVDAAHLVDAHTVRADLAAVLDGTRGVVAVLVGRRPLRDDDPLARLHPVVVDGAALAMSVQETAALVGRAVTAIVAPTTVAGPTEAVAGHAGVLARAAHELAADAAPAGDLAVRFGHAVDRAARRWTEAALPAGALRDAATTLAVVERMPLPLARTLVDSADAVLGALVDLGSGRLDDGADVFVWSAAAATVLRRDGQRDHLRLLPTVVRWALEHDDLLTGIDVAVRMADLDLLTTVLRAGWTRMTGAAAADVARLLDPVRLRTASGHPLVLAAIARSAAAAGRHHARASRAHAATVPAVAARLPHATAAEAVLLHAVDAQARRVVGDERGARRAASLAERGLAALDDADRDASADVLPFVLEQVAATALADGDAGHALARLAEIEPGDGEDGELQRAAATGAAALVHALVGEVAVATRLLDGDDAVPGAAGVLARAVVRVDRGDATGALELLDRVDPLFGAYEHWPIVLAVRARATSLLGRLSPADHLAEFDAEYERFRTRTPATGVGARLVARARIRLMLAAGQLQRAEEALAALGPARTWNAVERAGLGLARDEPETALDVVTGTMVRAAYEPRTATLLVLLRAVAEERAGDHTAAVVTFRAALDTLERTGMRGDLLTPPRADLETLAEAAADAGDDRALRWLGALGGLRSVLPDAGESVVLSGRESVVLGLLAGPGSLAEVAAELHVSVNTVKTQVRSVYRKLGVSGRRAAVERAHELGVLAV